MTTQPPDAAAEARLLLNVRKYDAAADAARRGLAGDPDNADLLGLLAAARDGAGDPIDARHWAEKALARDPQQAWIHNVRALAILNGAGHSRDALTSARAAVTLAPTTIDFRYTLAYAYGLEGKRDDAQRVAKSIRKLDPSSPLGPLAEAVTELCRVKIYEIRWWWAIIAVVITRGGALVIMALFWLVQVIRRRKPLQRADAHLAEALRLDPGDATALALAAHVAQLRFRFLQSLDKGLAAAMIDAGLVKADDLARQIARRSGIVAASTLVVWAFVYLVLYHIRAMVPVIAAAGLAGVALVAWLDWVQTSRLPAGVVRKVRRRWGFPVLSCCLAALALVIAYSGFADRGLAWTALVALPGIAAAVGSAILLIQCRAAR